MFFHFVGHAILVQLCQPGTPGVHPVLLWRRLRLRAILQLRQQGWGAFGGPRPENLRQV